MLNTEIEKFEQWAKTSGQFSDLSRSGSGFLRPQVQLSWMTWQAAAGSASKDERIACAKIASDEAEELSDSTSYADLVAAGIAEDIASKILNRPCT